jgi:hypothetical protein
MLKSFVAISFFAVVTVICSTSCKRCYDCEKQSVVETNNGDTIRTDAYYEQEVCKKREMESLEEQGYDCHSQL